MLLKSQGKSIIFITHKLKEVLRVADRIAVLRNGRVADGTGNPARFADVAIKDGRIAAIGKIKEHAGKELDARGMVIAPGFIDVHTHAEEIDDQPLAEGIANDG